MASRGRNSLFADPTCRARDNNKCQSLDVAIVGSLIQRYGQFGIFVAERISARLCFPPPSLSLSLSLSVLSSISLRERDERCGFFEANGGSSLFVNLLMPVLRNCAANNIDPPESGAEEQHYLLIY